MKKSKLLNIVAMLLVAGMLSTACSKEETKKKSKKSKNDEDIEEIDDDDDDEDDDDEDDEDKKKSKKSKKSKKTETTETTEEVPVEVPTTVTETTPAPTTETTIETTTEASTETTPVDPAASSTTTPSVTGNSAWVDFNDMHFYIYGNKVTLGQTTLQEIIDMNVTFEDGDVTELGNKLEPNSESRSLKIVLGDYYDVLIYVMNDTDTEKPMTECFISEVYLPYKADREQDVVSFDFSLTMTKEELVANAGETEYYSHYQADDSDFCMDTYDYKLEAERYYGYKTFSFEFTRDVLSLVYIRYVP